MNEPKKILVVDDDLDIRTLIGQYLTQNGYQVDLASNGDHMNDHLSQHPVDLIILDVMMPGKDGYEVCREIRQQSNIPIIMLTAIGEEFERIVGLEIGADDYMSKPFNPRELLARVKAILRRSHGNNPTQTTGNNTLYQFDQWSLDKNRRSLLSPDQLEISITNGEYDLLVTMLESPGQVLSRDQLLNATKNRDANPYDRSIDIQISRLRRLIEQDPKHPKLIKTIRCGGYLFSGKVHKTHD